MSGMPPTKGAMVAEEMIDVYDERGRWTGETLPKSQVHAQGKLHICVHGVITDGNSQVIGQFRGPLSKMMRNVWDVMSVAGHISALTLAEREDPANWDIIQQAWNALVREFQEEIGFDISGYDPFGENVVMFGVTRTRQITEDGWLDNAFSINFMLRIPGIDPGRFELEEGKVLDVKWIHATDIERALDGDPDLVLATREPDNYELLQGTVDAARRLTYSS